MKNFSHIDAAGAAKMVDVSAKPAVCRQAVARGEIRLQPATLAALEKQRIAKGNVLATARVAGLMAAKKTASITAQTGVEMEALTAVSVAALTIYDMCKAVDPAMLITGIKLVSKIKSAPCK